MVLSEFENSRGRGAPFESLSSAVVKRMATAASVEGFAFAQENAHSFQLLLLSLFLVLLTISAAFASAPI